MKEITVLGVAAFGSLLFLYHDAFYLQPGYTPPSVSLASYLLVTAVLYLFFRVAFLVVGLFVPKTRRVYVVCPECGRSLETAAHAHGATPRTAAVPRPRPSQREVLQAVALRRAIDEARRSSQHALGGPKPASASPEAPTASEDVENPPVPPDVFERILRQLDESRSSGGSSDDHRPKGPFSG